MEEGVSTAKKLVNRDPRAHDDKELLVFWANGARSTGKCETVDVGGR